MLKNAGVLIVEFCHLYHMEGGDVCVTPFCVRPEYPYSLVFSTSHKRQFTSLADYEH